MLKVLRILPYTSYQAATWLKKENCPPALQQFWDTLYTSIHVLHHISKFSNNFTGTKNGAYFRLYRIDSWRACAKKGAPVGTLGRSILSSTCWIFQLRETVRAGRVRLVLLRMLHHLKIFFERAYPCASYWFYRFVELPGLFDRIPPHTRGSRGIQVRRKRRKSAEFSLSKFWRSQRIVKDAGENTGEDWIVQPFQ